MDNKNFLIVLDSLEYKKSEDELHKFLSDVCDAHFFYSKYENGLTELFQRTRYIGGFLTHLAYWMMSFRYAVSLMGKRYRGYSSIIFINPIVGIFFCMLSRLLCVDRRKRRISIAGFLFEDKRSKLYYKVRKAFVNYCYSVVDDIIVYGTNEVKLYGTIFPSMAKRFKYVQYGRDFKYANAKDYSHDAPYIASGGRSNRRFETLCEAMSAVRKVGLQVDCVVATRPECVSADMAQSPVAFQYGITLNQFGSFIDGCLFFVLPLACTKLSAGHMVLMEVLAHEKPVIVTDISAIRDYVSDQEVVFYKQDDSADLAKQIEHMAANINSSEIRHRVSRGKELYETQFSFKALLRRIVCIVPNE